MAKKLRSYSFSGVNFSSLSPASFIIAHYGVEDQSLFRRTYIRC